MWFVGMGIPTNLKSLAKRDPNQHLAIESSVELLFQLNRLQPSMLRLTDHIAGAPLFTRVYEGIPLLKADLVWGAASNTTCFERRPAPACNMPVPQRGCGRQSGAEMDFGSGFKARGHNQESHKKEVNKTISIKVFPSLQPQNPKSVTS